MVTADSGPLTTVLLDGSEPYFGPAMIPAGYIILGSTVLLIWAAWREVMNGEPGG